MVQTAISQPTGAPLRRPVRTPEVSQRRTRSAGAFAAYVAFLNATRPGLWTSNKRLFPPLPDLSVIQLRPRGGKECCAGPTR